MEDGQQVLIVPQPDGKEVTYSFWSDGYAVGYKITRDDGKVEYLYFNPSNNDDGSDDPNVFVYSGETGDASIDTPHVHFVQRFGEEMAAAHDTPRSKEVEYGILLVSGDMFYTGGFDEPPIKHNVRWSAGISGTFSNDPKAKWHVTYISADQIQAVIDYRSHE